MKKSIGYGYEHIQEIVFKNEVDNCLGKVDTIKENKLLGKSMQYF